MSFADLPTGNPAPDDAQASILLTLHKIANCTAAGNPVDVSGFFSEDYFRRAWVRAMLEHNPNMPLSSLLPKQQGLNGSNHPFTYTDAQVLPDGRVAVYSEMIPGSGLLVIFINQNGTWVIDETIQVTDFPGGRG
jgi:hypothetical protein